jgi:hypothetical protein
MHTNTAALRIWLVLHSAGLMERSIMVGSDSNTGRRRFQSQSGLWFIIDRLTEECMC